MNDIIVIGIGNPFRGDDGAGWAVIDALDGKVNGKIHLRKQNGDMFELIELFADYSTIYLVDACHMNGPSGSWQRIDAHLQPILLDNPQTSTHGLSIKEAIAMAKNLNQLPSKLIIYAIKGDHYTMNGTISAPVSQAIAKVAQEILNEKDIQPCTKKV